MEVFWNSKQKILKVSNLQFTSIILQQKYGLKFRLIFSTIILLAIFMLIRLLFITIWCSYLGVKTISMELMLLVFGVWICKVTIGKGKNLRVTHHFPDSLQHLFFIKEVLSFFMEVDISNRIWMIFTFTVLRTSCGSKLNKVVMILGFLVDWDQPYVLKVIICFYLEEKECLPHSKVLKIFCLKTFIR